MKNSTMIFCVALVAIGVFVSYSKPDAGGIVFGHMLSVGGAFFFAKIKYQKK